MEQNDDVSDENEKIENNQYDRNEAEGGGSKKNSQVPKERRSLRHRLACQRQRLS